MRQAIFLFAVAVISLYSCTKDYSCTCTEGTANEVFIFENIYEQEATKACEELDEHYQLKPGSCKYDGPVEDN